MNLDMLTLKELQAKLNFTIKRNCFRNQNSRSLGVAGDFKVTIKLIQIL